MTHQTTHIHHAHNELMIAEMTTASKQITVNARLRGAPTDDIYAIIVDSLGNRYSKKFAHVADSKIQVIDFDSVPDGFFYRDREFKLTFAASLNDDDGYPIEMMIDRDLIFVTVVDDSQDDAEPQTIGEIAIP